MMARETTRRDLPGIQYVQLPDKCRNLSGGRHATSIGCTMAWRIRTRDIRVISILLYFWQCRSGIRAVRAVL